MGKVSTTTITYADGVTVTTVNSGTRSLNLHTAASSSAITSYRGVFLDFSDDIPKPGIISTEDLIEIMNLQLNILQDQIENPKSYEDKIEELKNKYNRTEK